MAASETWSHFWAKGSLCNDDGDGNMNGKKAIGLDWQKQQFCTYITLFCSFPCRRCTTMTWNCLISRFVEDVNRRQQPSVAFPELWYSPLESNSRQIRQHLTNLTRWNKRDEVWTRANKLFYWRFRSRRRCHCFKAPNRSWSGTAANLDFVLFANLVVSSNSTWKLTSRKLKLF